MVRERLKILTNEGTRMGRDSLTNLLENSSWPLELLFFRFLTVFIISVAFVMCKKIDWALVTIHVGGNEPYQATNY